MKTIYTTLSLAVLALSACTTTALEEQGNTITQNDIDNLKPGESLRLAGTPGSHYVLEQTKQSIDFNRIQFQLDSGHHASPLEMGAPLDKLGSSPEVTVTFDQPEKTQSLDDWGDCGVSVTWSWYDVENDTIRWETVTVVVPC